MNRTMRRIAASTLALVSAAWMTLGLAACVRHARAAQPYHHIRLMEPRLAASFEAPSINKLGSPLPITAILKNTSATDTLYLTAGRSLWWGVPANPPGDVKRPPALTVIKQVAAGVLYR